MAKAKKKKQLLASKTPKRRGLSLRKLVVQITKENRYSEISTGPARGKELA
jgi:antitoxin component of MazEF toxin-antitoxin module